MNNVQIIIALFLFVLQDRIKEIMLICFKAVENKLERKCGYFDLLGFDFMVDDNMNVSNNPKLNCSGALIEELCREPQRAQ